MSDTSAIEGSNEANSSFIFEETFEYDTEVEHGCENTIDAEKKLEERIQTIPSPQGAQYLIDKIIKLILPLSESERQSRCDYWKGKSITLEKDMSNHHVVNVLLLIVAFTAGIWAMNSTNFIPLAIVAVTACFSIYTTTETEKKRNEAREQLRKWSAHPAETLAQQRTEALSKGLLFIKRKDSAKTELFSFKKILSEVEITNMYKKYVNDFYREKIATAHTEKEKLHAIHMSMSHSPLSEGLIDYANLSQRDRYTLAPYISHYEALKNQYLTIKKPTNEKTQAINDHYSKLLQAEKEKKSKIIDSLEKKHHDLLFEKEKRWNERIERGEMINTSELELEREQAKHQHEEELANAAAPFDRAIAMLKQEQKEQLSRIQWTQDAALLGLFDAIKAVHLDALERLSRSANYWQPRLVS